MKKFAVVTQSESSDDYIYFIESEKESKIKELEKWLNKNGTDVFDGECYENIQLVEEITEFKRLK